MSGGSRNATTATLDPDRLQRFAEKVLTSLGVPAPDAALVAQCLLFSDLRGHASHGIVRLPVYGKRLRAGVVNPKAKPKIVSDTGALAVVDGDNGLGPVVGVFGMDEAIRRARQYGVGVVLARRSNHYGASGFYTARATEHGCIGISASNAPSNMAPWGGRERFLGTNPFSVGVPRSDGTFNADMATSVVARGNIILAAQSGQPIPSGWAIDPDGNPTTDAEQALKGSVLPFAGPKGAAISLAIDVLCGVLSGAAYGRGLNTLEDLATTQGLGHMFLALNVAACMPPGEFDVRMRDLAGQLKQTPRAVGVDEILLPGELEERAERSGREYGVEVPVRVVSEIEAFAETVDVSTEDLRNARKMQ